MATKSKKSVKTSTVTSITFQSNVIGSGLYYFIATGSNPAGTILASGSALTANLPVTVKVSGYDSYIVFFQDSRRSNSGAIFEDGVVIPGTAGTATVKLAVITTSGA